MKHKFNFILLSFKRNILPTLFLLFTICLVIFSKENLQATKSGLLLWTNSVVPALLPFFIATELLSYTNLTNKLGKLLNKYMRPIFNVPGIGAYAFIMGIISGYPVGAKIVTKFRNDCLCTKAEAERLLAFTNNSGPLFIIGTIGISMYGNTEIGLLLFISHFISCILVGITFRFWKYNDKEQTSLPVNDSNSYVSVNFSNLGEVLSKSILNSFNTIIMIGGFVIIFSVVISILNNCGFFNMLLFLLTPLFKNLGISTNFIIPITSGIIELTNGLSLVSSIAQKSISTNIIISAFILGFGGISVLLQVLSITSKSDISIKPYFIGKLLQGIFAAIITYVLIHICPVFNLDLAPTFSQNVNSIISSYSNFSLYGISFLIIVFFFIIYLRFKKCIKNLCHK
jgi:sporulation integral membrane protein YlbJ